jgi:diaminohydroxyphosphoribosylaminopyrimidine deaminase/5-amino-6-(5-phosphoribosylamino)uracil reductase
MTLDGKIAPSPTARLNPMVGAPAGGWITGEAARAQVHRQRHQSDAILVGVGTILADDPLLTDRSGQPRRRPLLRVILDSNLRIPAESRLAQSVREGRNDVLVFYSSDDTKKKSELEARSIRVEKIRASQDGRPDLQSVLRRLGELEITSVMIEGGAAMNGAALACGVVDKVFLYYAPKIMGSSGVPFLSEEGLDRMHQIPRLKHVQLHRFEEDFAVEGYLRYPYAE